ncbi:ATP-grasp domain-containing protein [Variovorax saccharolyticus]|uniref:ATP-grasp domain-containing protein n=1 Tax=Variovorax saccharolyticus TaxID=3053516 RepID=UPI002575253B|nr:ATP-grasp domain-containing protein [Variovorax sp. J22R187]MDM0018953.1 succinate--CoA ligase subunit beta [Variovorax sp. J22R187]
MNIHEYQGKDLLRRYGVATPSGFACASADEAASAATRLGGRAWVVKAQSHAARRDPRRGVRRAWSIDEVRRHAAALLGDSGGDGRPADRLLVEEDIEIDQLFHLDMSLDSGLRRVALVASSPSARAPERHRKVVIDPVTGLKRSEAEGIARGIGLVGKTIPQARALMSNLYEAFDASDASRAEIDPLVLTRDGRLMALDVRFSFDSNALFRQPDIASMCGNDADRCGTPTGGSIGGLANDAGLAMATMDMVRLYGGSPAGFIDVGGGATIEKVSEAFKQLLRTSSLQAVLVNVFGGILRCDIVAAGVVAAVREVGLGIPLVVRLRGANEDLGRAILARSGIAHIGASEMSEAAGLVVSAARGRP